MDIGEKPVQAWLKTKNNVCQTIDRVDYYKMGAVADTCEISAGWSEIGNIYDAVVKRLSEDIEVLGFAGGHASHSYMQGTNIYFTFLYMVENGVESARETYMRVVGIIMEETLKRGGSIAHHHGSGKYRTAWMPQEHGSSYPLLYMMKEALDPNHIQIAEQCRYDLRRS